LIKQIHVATVVVTFILFVIRGTWYYFRADKPLNKVLRFLPHINDTLLTVTGISMAFMYSISPLVETWFLAKLIALLLYIGLGMYAFREKRLYGSRLLAWCLALLVFVYILGVVRTHSALPFI
jgi:uncharacterized membrane protein SirB2